MQPLFHGYIQVRPGPAQLSSDQVGQHHHQHVRARMFGRAHVNRTGLQVHRFTGAEGLLDLR